MFESLLYCANNAAFEYEYISISHNLTFPKMSLMLFPEGDITFFSGDLVNGSESSSSVAGTLALRPALKYLHATTTG